MATKSGNDWKLSQPEKPLNSKFHDASIGLSLMVKHYIFIKVIMVEIYMNVCLKEING